MPNCKCVTRSGAVLEIEYYPVLETVRDMSKTSPKPENVRTPEEKEQYNRHKSEQRLIRLTNTNFTSKDWFVTVSYNNENLPESYEQAQKNLADYIRRLRYLNPNVRIIAVTGYGRKSGRPHHHLIIGGVSETDIKEKWKFSKKIIRIEHLRKSNYYNGVDHGEDFTALAVYLHKHTPTSYKGKRWKQTKSIQQPVREKSKKVIRVYSTDHPPKAPKGFMLVEARTSGYYKSGYVYFKYVREIQQPPNIQPNCNNQRAGISARL